MLAGRQVCPDQDWKRAGDRLRVILQSAV